MSFNPNQFTYDPSVANVPPNAVLQNQIFPPLSNTTKPIDRKKSNQSSPLSRIPSLHLPAILLLAFCWLIHTIATFIPYWSVYSGIAGSRAGLWSARNFNYITIQNFFFPEPNSFPNLTESIRFGTANTKGYLITVQFLMTFNFVMMTILLILLVVDYIISRRSPNAPRSALIRQQNTSDTALIYGLLIYVLYVFTVFEFAAWITYAGSRHDNNWRFHASFGLTIVISLFLIIVFAMYVIEFLRIFEKNRMSWEYWYGPYIEWGFFVHLSALLLLLLVICCPEWAYQKYDEFFIFAEIGPFKQCFLSVLYKKTPSPRLCTLSNSRSNQAWVNATQAFILMAFIFGTILLIVMIVFRKQFRHNQLGYHSNRFAQPTFTFVIAGLILFFCFIFTLIAISIFGAEVFPNSIRANWGYIVAVFAMVLFLIAGILFILDGVHSRKQTSAAKASKGQKLLFPEPLNSRVSAMQPLLKAEPRTPPVIPTQPLQAAPPLVPPVIPYDFSQVQPPISPGPYFDNASFFPPQQTSITPRNYALDQYPNAPIAEGTLSNYFQQRINNPQSLPPPDNLGLGRSASENPSNRNVIFNNENLSNMVRQHFFQQQHLNYNHERLIEKYGRLHAPRASDFRSYGANSLPGRNYDQYLRRIRSDDSIPNGNSLAAQSRARIGSSDETYRWMDNEYYDEPLPRYVSSAIQHSRDDPTPSVRAENFEPVQIYNHPIFGPTPAYLRATWKREKGAKKKDQKRLGSNHLHPEKQTKVLTTKEENRDKEITDRPPLGYLSHQYWKTRNDRLVPVDPFLFNTYNQRSNGHIQGSDQSLYAPPSHDERSNLYENMTTTSLSDTELVLAGENRSDKLHSQSNVTSAAPQLPGLSSSDPNDDSSGHVIRRSNPSSAFQSRNNSNSLTFFASSSKSSPAANSAESIASLSSNAFDSWSIPLAPLKSKLITTSDSLAPYQGISSTSKYPSTVVTRSESKEPASTNDHVLSSNSDNGSDKKKNIKRDQAKKN